MWGVQSRLWITGEARELKEGEKLWPRLIRLYLDVALLE